MARFIYKMVIEGAQIVGRAFARALKQEMAASQQAAQRRATSAGANKESATQDLKHGISLEEAIKILNIEKQLNKEDIESKYKHLFEVNDRSKGGSFYIQSKVRNILKSSCSPSFHTLASLQRSSNLVCITSSSQQRLYSTNSYNSNELDVFEKAISDSSLTAAFQHLEKIGANLKSRSRQGNIKDGDSNLRRASVFVPFCRDQDHKPSILVTLRSSRLVTHKWEVSFPGGKESRKDGGDVIETAVRETIEELGIDRNSLKTYGALNPIIRQKQNSSIYPVLGYLDHDFSRQNLTNFNSSEVEKIIIIPLEKACNAENWNYTQWKSGWVTPIYHDDVCNGRQIPRIWGLTASLMSMILKIVLPQHFKGRLPVMKS